MSAFEKKYSVPEVAALIGCSRDTVRRRFRYDPTVGRVGKRVGRYKRAYFTLLIPESAVRKWWDELRRNGL